MVSDKEILGILEKKTACWSIEPFTWDTFIQKQIVGSEEKH